MQSDHADRNLRGAGGPSGLAEILRRKAEREAQLRKSLASIVGQLKAMGALMIVLFGSLGKEEIDVRSDLDLLVIMPADRSGKEWSRLIYEKVERGVDSDIVVYNQEEFREMMLTSSFVREVLDSGRVVYERPP